MNAPSFLLSFFSFLFLFFPLSCAELKRRKVEESGKCLLFFCYWSLIGGMSCVPGGQVPSPQGIPVSSEGSWEPSLCTSPQQYRCLYPVALSSGPPSTWLLAAVSVTGGPAMKGSYFTVLVLATWFTLRDAWGTQIPMLGNMVTGWILHGGPISTW